MDWSAIDPEWQGVISGAVVADVAVMLGWLAGWLLGKPAQAWVARNAPNVLGGLASHFRGLIRSGVAALLLTASMGLPFDDNGTLIVTIALGASTALFVRGLARSFGLNRGWSALLALLAFLAVAIGWLGGLDPLTGALDRAYLMVGKTRISVLDVVQGILVAVLLFAAARGLNRVLLRWIGGAQALDLSQRVLFQKLAQVAVSIFAILVGIDLLGIDLTALAFFSGAFGLAVGFGLQKTFGNLISGLILLMDRSIKPGDVIAIGNTFGWVNKISVRYVSLVTRDGKEHLLPNETLMTEPVENWSYTNKDVRLHIPVGVAHGCDIHQAKTLMLEACNATKRVLAEPAPVCWVTAFTSRAIEHELRIWICDPENGVTNVQSEVLTRIWDLFRREGIVLPFEQHDVYVHNATSSRPAGTFPGASSASP